MGFTFIEIYVFMFYQKVIIVYLWQNALGENCLYENNNLDTGMSKVDRKLLRIWYSCFAYDKTKYRPTPISY